MTYKKGFSLILHFPVSRSKSYQDVVNLAGMFDMYTKGDVNRVAISLNEIFEKWEFFNLIFWKVVDWKGMILELDEMKYHSHMDKTRLFYALQQAHDHYICYMEDKMKELHRVKLGECSYEDLGSINWTDEDVNKLLDYYQALRIKKDTPVKHSDHGKS